MTDAIGTHHVQAAAEGVQIVGDGRKVEFLGSDYRMAEKIGLMPLMRFAHVSSKGLDSDDMEGLAAMYTMIQDCIDPADWKRFEADAIEKKAEAEDLFGVVKRVIEILSARPTQRPADSSAGPQPTSVNSKASSSSPVTTPTLSLVEGVKEELIPVTSLTGRLSA